MIRKFELSDIEPVISIWLECNIHAHSFISTSYWESHIDFMKEELPRSEVYVYSKNQKVVAFIGLKNNYIAGLFVQKESQSQGIGSELLSYIKQQKKQLYLSVFAKNEKAIQFYLKENFKLVKESLDINTNEIEFSMLWDK